MIAGFKIPAALAVGNTVVVVLAEAAPLSLLLLAEISPSTYRPECSTSSPASDRGARASVQHPGVDSVLHRLD